MTALEEWEKHRGLHGAARDRWQDRREVVALADAALAELRAEVLAQKTFARMDLRERLHRCPAWNLISIRAARELNAAMEEDS